MEDEVLFEIQFAFTVAFHYIYPPLSVGLSLLMVVFESIYIRTKNKEYHILGIFWTKIFALTFVVGMLTNIVRVFEFGTEWAMYAREIEDIFGHVLTAEVMFTFALTCGFLGVLLLGWDKVKPWTYFLCVIGVFFCSMFSIIWLVIANSWQQTPAGYSIIKDNNIGAYIDINNFWTMVFNPSSVERFMHVWLGACLSGAFLVLSVHAFYLLKNKQVALSKKAFKVALIIATVFSLGQLLTGHQSIKGVAKNQPTKLAALEGHYATNAPADMYVFGWVDEEEQTVSGLKMPGGLSFLLNQDTKTPVRGLKYFPEDEIPPQINAVFQFYHLMLVIGVLLIGLSLLACFLWLRGKLFDKRWFLRLMVFAVLLPQIANQAGWLTAETGKQPWIIYEKLKISDAFFQRVSENESILSSALFSLIYILLLSLFVYLLGKIIKKGFNDDNLNNSSPDSGKLFVDILKKAIS